MRCAAKPALYAPSTHAFWDDEHISKNMLEAHLNPNWDAATRNHAFIDRSAGWIAQVAPPSQYSDLLDLGCGPGLYAQRFSAAGYSVTGVDFSKRSIAYAKEQAERSGRDIRYLYQNYLEMGYTEQFDVVTLIYCDYAALSITERRVLADKVYRALRQGGKFIFDVFTPRMRRPESRSWGRCEQGGFFSEEPHICLEAVYQYEDEDQTELRQSVILTQKGVQRYHIWDHFFTREQLTHELGPVGFSGYTLYGDIAGRVYCEDSETICGVFVK